LEAGKKRLAGDTKREATSSEVTELRQENEQLKQVVKTALNHPEASPRELAWLITNTQDYFISESSVYRILKRCDLITSPAYIVMSASDHFQHPTRCVNELWKMDFTCFRVVG